MFFPKCTFCLCSSSCRTPLCTPEHVVFEEVATVSRERVVRFAVWQCLQKLAVRSHSNSSARSACSILLLSSPAMQPHTYEQEACFLHVSIQKTSQVLNCQAPSGNRALAKRSKISASNLLRSTEVSVATDSSVVILSNSRRREVQSSQLKYCIAVDSMHVFAR